MFSPLSGAERLGSLLGRLVSPIWWEEALCVQKRASFKVSPNTHINVTFHALNYSAVFVPRCIDIPFIPREDEARRAA